MAAIAPHSQAQSLRLYGPPVIQYIGLCSSLSGLEEDKQQALVANSLAAKSCGLEKVLTENQDLGFSEFQFSEKNCKIELGYKTIVSYPEFSFSLKDMRGKANIEIAVSAPPSYGQIRLKLSYDPATKNLLAPEELRRFLDAATPVCEKTLGVLLSEYQQALALTGTAVKSGTLRVMTSTADLGEAAKQMGSFDFKMRSIFSKPSQFDPFWGFFYLTFGKEVRTYEELSALKSSRDIYFLKITSRHLGNPGPQGFYSVRDRERHCDLIGLIHQPSTTTMTVKSETAELVGKLVLKEMDMKLRVWDSSTS